MKFKCPVCKAEFPSLTETDWDNWLAHLVEEKRKAFEMMIGKSKQMKEFAEANNLPIIEIK